MIAKARIRKIIFNWIINSKEYKEACEKNKSLSDWLNKTSYSVLTDGERSWVKKYGGNFYLNSEKKCITVDLFKKMNTGTEEQIRSAIDYRFLSYCRYLDTGSYEYLFNSSDFRNKKLIRPEDLSSINVDKDCPILIESYSNFKEQFPKECEEFTKKYTELMLILCKLDKKLLILANTLFKKDMSLRSLKKYYKSLYDYSL